MGCRVSTHQSELIAPFGKDGPLRKQRTDQTLKSPKPQTQELVMSTNVIGELTPSRKEASRLTHFKISQADLVTEKRGSILNEYSLLMPPIGRGAFGEVRRAVHKKTNLVRAIKIILKESTSEEEREKLINEVKILKSLDHPNIMKVFEFYQDEKAIYIVSEFYSGGELFDKITEMKSFSEKLAAVTIKQMLSAVYYCHQHNIVHRDLKPENVLYETKKPDALLKLIDFGTSRIFDATKKMSQKFGTPYYIAPEVLTRKYDEKCDIWSCGVILFIFLCGYPPFNGESDQAIMDSVKRGKYDFDGEEWNSVSDDAKLFINKLLEYDPKKRYSAEQALADPWISKQSGRKLQEAVWLFLVNCLASREEKRDLFKTFQALDKNGDGQLTREELITGYKELLNIPEPEADVDAIMKSVDYNNSGTIDYTEFVVATINRQKILSKDRLEAAFKMFDKDGNGFLTIDELKEAFGSNFDDEVWHEVIKECDDNSDGKISFKEFSDMMLKFIDQA